MFEHLIAPPPWHADALCKEPPYRRLPWMVPGGTPPAVIEQMRSVCRACLVHTECRRFARAHRDVVGHVVGRDDDRPAPAWGSIRPGSATPDVCYREGRRDTPVTHNDA
jgi:hypothetical protein